MARKAPGSTRGRGSATVDSMSHHQIVVLALYLCGGATSPVDTEDVAVRANELAPGRFTWRKHAEQINLEHVRVYLSAAKNLKNGELVIGTGDEGWMLTPAGQRFAGEHISAAPGTTRRRLSTEEKRWVSRERVRLLSCEATKKVIDDRANEITLREAEQFFRLDDYVLGEARKRKISRLINLLGDDDDLGSVIRAVADRLEVEQRHDP